MKMEQYPLLIAKFQTLAEMETQWNYMYVWKIMHTYV